jgi:putative DNA methylase
MSYRKKLIEVALPLPEINDASAYDKMPGVGPHPKGIHHWWARLPLPTARVVLFASVVDDPSVHPEKWCTEEAQDAERERLFDIMRRMMGKKLHEHPEVYAAARAEMLKHVGGELPAVFDPFAGGGSLPLEAKRLGFEVHAGDLNPVAVLLNKCSLEIVPRWAGRSPVNPKDRKRIGGEDPWPGARGLAADVRHYGRIVRNQARQEIGHLYPKARLPKQYGGGEANVIAWMWARTVASPDPAARGVHVPLISTFWLSSKKGSEAWLEPVVNRTMGTYHFEVQTGTPSDRAIVTAGTKNGKGGFRCLLTDAPIPFKYVRAEGASGRIGFVMLAVVAELTRGRVYLPASADQLEAAALARTTGFPDTDLPDEALGFRIQNYGIRKHWQMFTPRQLTALMTLSDLTKALRSEIHRDAVAAGLSTTEAESYAGAVVTFLALTLSRTADYNNAFNRWRNPNPAIMNLFSLQAISMVWDFVEGNPVGSAIGSWEVCIEREAVCIQTLCAGIDGRSASARQVDAASGSKGLNNLLVSTDPPYYDNIGYADLSDFFYVWLRRTIGDFYPDLFGTVLVPKTLELTAAPERFNGDKQKAKEHFESGFRRAFTALREGMDPRFPLTLYYAFKQADAESASDDAGSAPGINLTTGWETLLEAAIASGFQITGTWPVRASQAWRMRAMGANALASYVVLACRPRADDAPKVDRRSFVAELKRELPAALRHLQQGNIAPVDFAQAAIGPGMAVYSRYRQILESSGRTMTVRAALYLINQTLTEVLSEQEDDFDADSRWAIAWFDQHGFGEGDFGEAELLSKAKATSVAGLREAGLIHSRGGKVRLLRLDELPDSWDPSSDKRLTNWEMTHHLLRVYVHDEAGDVATATLLRKLGSRGEIARELAYRLYDICEKRKRSQEAQRYNALVLGWPEIARLARDKTEPREPQRTLFEQG